MSAACLDADPHRAAALAESVAAEHDLREAWLALAAARRLEGDAAGAAKALSRLLAGYVAPSDPEFAAFATVIARGAGAAGWCGVTADGRLLGCASKDHIDPDAGRVFRGGRELIGSPLDRRALRRTAGRAWAAESGIEGWAWRPGNPSADPVLVVQDGSGRSARPETIPIGALDFTDRTPPGPLVRPSGFRIGLDALKGLAPPLRVIGDEGGELSGSPIDPWVRLPPSPPVGGAKWSQGVRSRGGVLTYAFSPGSSPPKGGEREGAAALLVTHDQGGGVLRHVDARCAALRGDGLRPLVLRPEPPTGLVLTNGIAGPKLRFHSADEWDDLIRFLLAEGVSCIELHHLLGHSAKLLDLPSLLGVAYEVYVHDYAWFCPRVTMLNAENRYCGEPDLRHCEAAVTAAGSRLEEPISVAALRSRSRTVLAAARRVVAPSRDAALRVRAYAPVDPIIIPHEDDGQIAPSRPVQSRRVCVAGAIGIEKGFEILLACARDAALRRLALEFVVVGHTIDDRKLMDAGPVFVTGPYQEHEAAALIRAQLAFVGLLPSIWPETWCYALTALWNAGLDVLTFDLGAQAERVRRTGRGRVVPLGAPPSQINDALLAMGCGPSDKPP